MIDLVYKNRYEKYIEHYKNKNVNPWHEINEIKLNEIYNYLINNMDINDEYSFNYFINYIIKRLSGKDDAHTKYDCVSIIPMNFKVIEGEILVNFPENLKGSRLISINNISINDIINELEDIITYGTEGKRRFEIEKSLLNRYALFSLPSFRYTSELIFEIEKINKEKEYKKITKEEEYSKEELFDYDEYVHDNPATYKFVDNILIYNHTSIQGKFNDRIIESIKKLEKEDLSNIDTFIIDIRGNTGGSGELNKPLIDFLKKYTDKKLICLTDYRVFSGGRYALVNLIKLGSITIGEEISTPINCYGNCDWIENDNFASSRSYLHPVLGWSAESKKEFNDEVNEEILKPVIFKPTIYVTQTKEDYINNVDTILEYEINYAKEKNIKR